MPNTFSSKLAVLDKNYQIMKKQVEHVDAYQLEKLAEEEILQKREILQKQLQQGRSSLLKSMAALQENYLQEMQEILLNLEDEQGDLKDLIAEYFLDFAELTFWQATYLIAKRLK